MPHAYYYCDRPWDVKWDYGTMLMPIVYTLYTRLTAIEY
jgi:hypothetical protein